MIKARFQIKFLKNSFYRIVGLLFCGSFGRLFIWSYSSMMLTSLDSISRPSGLASSPTMRIPRHIFRVSAVGRMFSTCALNIIGVWCDAGTNRNPTAWNFLKSFFRSAETAMPSPAAEISVSLPFHSMWAGNERIFSSFSAKLRCLICTFTSSDLGTFTRR